MPPSLARQAATAKRAAEALHPLSRQAGSPLRSLEVFGSLKADGSTAFLPGHPKGPYRYQIQPAGLQLGHYEAWKLDGADWQMELERTGVLRDMMGLLNRQKMIEHVETEQKNLKNGCTLICRARVSTAHWQEPPCFITLLGKINHKISIIPPSREDFANFAAFGNSSALMSSTWSSGPSARHTASPRVEPLAW